MKIICIGENFKEQNEVEKGLHKPFYSIPIYLKPESALQSENKNDIYIPDFTQDFQCGVQLVIKISKQGKNIAEKFAHRYYQQITLGIDFTANDLLEKFISQGMPWELAKSFDKSAIIGKFIDKENLNIENINFCLLLNGKKVQEANGLQMIRNFDEVVAYISRFFTLKTGDLIFTGSLSSSINLEIGDELDAFLEGDKVLSAQIL